MSQSLSFVRQANGGFVLVMFLVGIPLILCNPMPSNDLQDVEGDEGLCAEWAADDGDCALFYSCIFRRSNCRSIRHSAASLLCRRVNSISSPHHRRFEYSVLQWAQRINRCVVQRISRQFAQDDVIYGSDRRACSESTDRMRSAMTWCAQQNDVNTGEECKAVLITGRQTALSLVGQNWMWLVEMMSACPRDVMHSFIRWAMNNISS